MAAFSVAFYKQNTAANASGIDLFIPVINVSRYILSIQGNLLREFWKLDISSELLICL